MNEKKSLPQKPSDALGVFAWWMKKLFWLGARTICPRCEKGQMFESFFRIHKKCPECKVTFQPYSGDELGVIGLGYFVTVAPSLLGLTLAHLYLHWSPTQLFAFYLFLTAAILIGFYPNIKGVWVAFVYLLTGLKKRL